MEIFLVLPILIPIIAGVLQCCVKALRPRRTMRVFTAAALVLTLLSVLPVLLGGDLRLDIWHISGNLAVMLKTDDVSRLFAGLGAAVWLIVGFYAFSYMKHEEREHQFFGVYLMTIGAILGLDFAGNIVTMYLFFELVTLASFPLVLHTRSKESIAAAQKFLFYSIAGAFLALLGVFFLFYYSSTGEFAPGGFLDSAKLAGHEGELLTVVFLAIVGFGAKAGMFPLHSWLPSAHPVAPSPASAVLSGLITKAGVLAIVRVVFYAAGAKLISGTWVQTAWILLALLTIFMGSLMAYREPVLKKRLAYSTVSQVSYVLLGLAVLTGDGVTGGLLHVLFHSITKHALFLVAGAIIVQTGCTRVEELRGIGKRMPITMWCYTLLSLTLIGIPPTSGFVSKWYLATGSLAASGVIGALSWIAPLILLVSALLTAGYLLPISVHGFFPGADFDRERLVKCEPEPLMYVPIIILTAGAVLLGVFPSFLIDFIRGIAAAIL